MKTFVCLLMLLFACAISWSEEDGNSKKSTNVEKADPKVKLKDGDIVALCGDSITSNGFYPYFIEMYQLVCAPAPKVTLKNFGQWGKTANDFPPLMDASVLPLKPAAATIYYGMNNSRSSKVMSDESAKNWGTGEITTVIKKFKGAGIREIFLGSPGCVDSEFFTLSQSLPSDPKAVEATNKNLSLLRDNAEKIAKAEGLVFVDVHTPMIEVMAKAKEKYGKDFPFAGGKGDGVHPGQAGHLVMAWAFIKAFGYSGEIGTITLDFAKDTAEATTGHSVIACKSGVVSLESSRYPFCFSGDPEKPSAGSTRSVAGLFPFNEDLNRFTLVVKNAPAKTKITWGKVSKEYDSATLSKGINLASEFMDNPFGPAFAKVFEALQERNRCYGWLAKEYKDNPDMQKRLERALVAATPVPVKHEIKIEPVN